MKPFLSSTLDKTIYLIDDSIKDLCFLVKRRFLNIDSETQIRFDYYI